MRNRNNFTIALYTAALICLLDQMSKSWLVDELREPGAYYEVITSYFNIVYVLNRGITFGMLNKIDHEYIAYGLIAVSALVVLMLGRWLWHTTSRLISFALGLVIGGAIGNVIDRVRYGAVVDFLDVHYKDIYHWPAFNLADSAIVTGVALLMFDSLVRRR